MFLTLRSLKVKLGNYAQSSFAREAWKKMIKVEKDYLRLLKGVLKISFFSLCLFLVHQQIPYFNTYEIEFVENETNRAIVNALQPIDYKPTFYLPSCLAMMIYNEVKAKPEVNYKREFIQTLDEGIISLDWVVNTNEEDNKTYDKLLVILHGLTGGSESSYIREIVEEYHKRNEFKIVVVNYRGLSETPLITPSIYHIGYYDDIYLAMKYIKENYPNVRCYTLGTSMGGNIFTKLFSNHTDFNDYVKGFISVSNPINCYEVEKRNRGGILDFFIIQRQLRYIEKHKHILKGVIDFDKLSSIKSYRDYDQIVTLKLFSFESVDEYYLQSSCFHDLEQLKIPSLFLNAKNDLLSPVDVVDLENTFRKNKNIILILTRWGGHVCWFAGWKPKRWFINKTIKYIEVLEELEKARRTEKRRL